MFKRIPCLLALFGVMFLALPLALAEKQESEHQEPAETAEHFHSTVNLHRFIRPAGIATLSFLFATLALGLNVHRNRKALLGLHKTLAITTACLALLHLSLVLFS